MEIGIIGLGKMGAGIARRLVRGGHRVVAFDRDSNVLEGAEELGAISATSIADVALKLQAPRAVWMMVPCGAPADDTVQALLDALSPGDVIIDGGNSNYKKSMSRAAALQEQGISFLDVGTSGGVWGEENGYCLMIGGENAAVERLSPIFETLSSGAPDSYGHVGPSGAGHFVKMVHNGAEYGMMQALAEGFALLASKEELHLDLSQVGRIWRQGSVVRSWLLDLIVLALEENPDLEGVAPFVPDSGEGRWTVKEAIDQNVACPVITASLLERIASRESGAFHHKLLSALRNQFGGHEVKKG